MTILNSCGVAVDVRTVNKELRASDDSHLWPICGRFNATERAIRRVRKTRAATGDHSAYREAVEAEISRIVNAEQ